MNAAAAFKANSMTRALIFSSWASTEHIREVSSAHEFESELENVTWPMKVKEISIP